MRAEPVTPPAEEPVSLSEVRDHLRLGDDTSQDAALAVWVQAARERCEARTGRAFVTQTADLFLDRFPYGGGFYLRRIRELGPTYPSWLPGPVAVRCLLPPLQSVTWVKYYDTDGAQQTLDASQYRVLTSASTYGKVEPALNCFWPATATLSDAVNLRVVCGYGDAAAVPAAVKAAMLLIVGHYYEHREEVLDGPLPAVLDRGVDHLLGSVSPGRYQ